MTVKQLKAKHKRRKMAKNGIGLVILTIAMLFFMDMALDVWVEEIDNHGRYNRQYQQEMERLGN